MLNRKGSVALTEHQQVSWKLIKGENWDNKNYKKHTHSNLILFFNETCYFLSNFYFE